MTQSQLKSLLQTQFTSPTTAFQKLDKDRDTFITLNDFQMFLVKKSISDINSADLEQIFDQFAKQKNHGLNPTEFAQFWHFYQNRQQIRVDNVHKYQFEVTPADLKHFRNKLIELLEQFQYCTRKFYNSLCLTTANVMWEDNLRKIMEEIEGRNFLDVEWKNIYVKVKRDNMIRYLSFDEFKYFLEGESDVKIIEEEDKEYEEGKETVQQFPSDISLEKIVQTQQNQLFTTNQINQVKSRVSIDDQIEKSNNLMFVQHVNRMLFNRGVKFADLIKKAFPGKQAVENKEIIKFFRNKIGTHYALQQIKSVLGAEYTYISDLLKTFA